MAARIRGIGRRPSTYMQDPYDVDGAVGAEAVVEGVRSCGELAIACANLVAAEANREGSPQHLVVTGDPTDGWTLVNWNGAPGGGLIRSSTTAWPPPTQRPTAATSGLFAAATPTTSNSERGAKAPP